ncbi:hypothetical protein LLG96_16990 [bacterium]|nr:hypothetical protein [bacterium]
MFFHRPLKIIGCMVCTVAIFMITGTAQAQDPRDMYARHLYFDSIRQLETMGNSAEVNYIIGLNYYRLGSLYDELFVQAAFFEKRYYEMLAQDMPAINRNSRLLMYKGICHYALREFDDAVKVFEQAETAEKDPLYKARIQLWKQAAAICKKGNTQGREDWNRLLDEALPPLKPEAQFLFFHENKYRHPGITAQAGYAGNDPFCRRSLIALNAAAGNNDMAGKLAEGFDFDKPFETIAGMENSVINLYDPFLLEAFSVMAYAKAGVYFEKSLSLASTSKNMQPVCWLGRTYLELGQLSKAVETLSGDKSNTLASVFLGEAYWRAGDSSKADKEWKTVKKSNDPIVLRELGYVCAKLKTDLGGAEELARKALQLKKKADGRRLVLQPYFGCLGFVLFQQNRIQDANEEFSRGFNADMKHTVEDNDPEFTLQYSRSLFLPDVLSYDLINQSMLTLSQAYKGAFQLRNAMSGIYIITFKNLDGGKVRDGM